MLQEQRRRPAADPPTRPARLHHAARRRRPPAACAAGGARRTQRHAAHRRPARGRGAGLAGQPVAGRLRHLLAGARRLPAAVLVDGDSGPRSITWRRSSPRCAASAPPAGAQRINAALKSRVQAFQLAAGAQARRPAGPTTFMQLRARLGLRRAASGEPRLRRGPLMSYILDALKKADAERERETAAVPDLHAQADAGDAARARGAHAGGWVALGASVRAGLALAGARRGAGSSPRRTDTPAPAPDGCTGTGTGGNARAATDRHGAGTGATAPAPVPAAPRPHSHNCRRPRPRRPCANAAPAAARRRPARTGGRLGCGRAARCPHWPSCRPTCAQQLPALAVGGSVYSPSAASRIVILNGQVLREGDGPSTACVVERIRLQVERAGVSRRALRAQALSTSRYSAR